MKSLAFAHYTDTLLTLIGLGLFITVFLGWVAWVNLKPNRELYKKIARELLEDGKEI